MFALPIYTALNVPTVSSYPSINCLQWSGDGQAFFISKSAIYILTPDPGINFDSSSVIKAPVGKENEFNKPLGWFRTMVECNKDRSPEKPHIWPDISHEWGAVSLGSLDLSVRSAACSPSNLTSDGRCVLASLNTNMEVSLWAATKNHLKGEWVKVQDVTAFLSEHVSLPENKSSLSTIFQVQTTSIAWSSQPDFRIVPAPCVDGSIFVTGNRAGRVIFLRFLADSSLPNRVRHLTTIKVSEKWITHLAWSPWILTDAGTCKAYLAYGTADGGLGLILVTEFLQPVPTKSGFGNDYRVELLHELSDCQPPNGDGSNITALSWVEIFNKNLILVHSKPGMVHLWSAPPLAAGLPIIWSGSRTMALQTQQLSVGSSSLYPVSGMTYIQSEDALMLCLFDGSFHVIHGLSVDPSYFPPNPLSELTSEKLSSTSRSIFAKTSFGDIRRKDVNRTSGMMSYDGSSTVMWAHEACRPTDFSYKHEAKHNSMLVVTQLWADVNDHAIIDNLSRILISAKSASGSVPIHLLRSIFLHISKCGNLVQLLASILEVLQQPFINDSVNVVITPWSAGGLVPELKLDFRRSLARHLFGSDNLLNLRMRLSIADMCWKSLLSDSQEQAECGQIAQHLLTTIAHWVLRTIIRHLIAIMTTITATDIPFVLRIVVQGLLPGLPPDLSLEAQSLSANLHATVSEVNQSGVGLQELCPACNVEVPLVDITSALCANGHAWARCTITSFILSTPMVRTCVGCSRKAFLPLSRAHPETPNWLPPAARSWVVEELLEAVHRCLFCGNSFVSIL